MAVTNNGYEIPTLADIVAAIETGQKTIFPNIILDESSPDAQLNGLFSEIIITAYEVAVGVYNGMDPRTAAGVMLDRTCALTGVIRKQDSYSTVTVTFSGSIGALIPSGTLLSASTIPNSLYIVQVDTVVDGAGVGTTSAYFKNPGAVDIPAFAVDTIDTPLPGITSVTNPTDGVTGQTRETDSELRVRREQSLFTNSIALIDSVDSGVREVTGVTDCRVFENYTDATNIDGIPAHSIMVVTEGGVDQEIGDAIMENKSLGCGLHGSIGVTWFDQNGFSHPVYFERPTAVPIFIKVKVDNTSPGIIQDIRSKIINYVASMQDNTDPCVTGTLGIGDDVYASIFYPPIIGSPDYTILSIKVDTVSPAALDSVIIGNAEISTYLSADIEVTL